MPPAAPFSAYGPMTSFLAAETIEWVERLGGWGVMAIVLVTGLRWLTTRADRGLNQMEAVIDRFTRAACAFERFEREEHKSHEQILRELKEIKLAVQVLQQERLSNEPRTKG